MVALHFSFIIPVYNRPDEIKELLDSFLIQDGDIAYEIIIVEDGSQISSKEVVDRYSSQLNITYCFKPNSGPGDSRNFGMKMAKGNYFIILDSDCLLPKHYIQTVANNLKDNYVDCFGGPDAAHSSFTSLQKAINFAMTSFITTGGIRGGKASNEKFQPRSFNMGISKEAFESSGGFGVIHPGEDPDLSIRLISLGFKTKLFSEAFVYHKRRISWSKFYNQVHKFGLVRPILNHWHPHTNRLVFWLPTLFCLGFIIAIVFAGFGYLLPIIGYGLYFFVAFIIAILTTKHLGVALQSMLAIAIQFFGYGYGFLKSTLAIKLFNKVPEQHFPNLFFKHAD